MATDYKQLQKEVTKLIKDEGILAKINHLDGGSSNCYIIFGGYLEENINSEDLTHSTTIEGEEVTAIITNVKKELIVGDKINVDELTYRIQDFNKIKPTNINLLYKVTLNLL